MPPGDAGLVRRPIEAKPARAAYSTRSKGGTSSSLRCAIDRGISLAMDTGTLSTKSTRCSVGGPTAGNIEGEAGGEAALGAGDPGHHVGDLVDRAEPAQGNAPPPTLDELLRHLLEEVG